MIACIILRLLYNIRYNQTKHNTVFTKHTDNWKSIVFLNTKANWLLYY